MGRILFIVSLFFFTTVGVGCAIIEVENELRFKTSKQVYSPGEQVNVLLENDTVFRVGLNLCYAFLSLERKSNSDDWEQLPVGLGPVEGGACTSEMIGLSPGKSIGGVAYLPTDQSPGIYRITTLLEQNNNNFVGSTNSFEIR